MFYKLFVGLCTVVTFASASAQGQAVEVQKAWIRATVPGQKASGVFMQLKAKETTRLVGAASAAAGVVEVHEMTMEADVMKMRAISGIDLPAGKTVELKPGGYHIMLMDLKNTLRANSNVGLTLLFKNAQGEQSKLDLQVPVRSLAAADVGHQHQHQQPHQHGMQH